MFPTAGTTVAGGSRPVRHLSLTPKLSGMRAARLGLTPEPPRASTPIEFAAPRPDTPLTFAAARGLCGVIDVLVSRGADVNKTDQSGKTALLTAAANGQTAAAAALIRVGADVNRADRQGWTPLNIAAYWNHADLVDLLVPRADINRANAHGVSPLLSACDRGNTAVAKALIRAGANITQASTLDASPLALACTRSNVELVRLLLDSGALDDIEKAEKKDGNTPLMLAIEKDQMPIADLLLEAGANPNAVRGDGKSAIHLAVEKGNAAAVAKLLAAGADIEAMNLKGLSPLMVACSKGHAEVFRVLLEARADTKKKTPSGWSCLHFAAFHGFAAIVEALLQCCGTDEVDCANEIGDTPLLFACSNGFAEVVALLLRAGASPSKANHEGQTPLTLATSKGAEGVVECLLRAGADPAAALTLTKSETIWMLLVLFNSRVLPEGWTKLHVFQKLAEIAAKRCDRLTFEAAALGCPLGLLKAALFAGGKVPDMALFTSIDPSSFVSSEPFFLPSSFSNLPNETAFPPLSQDVETRDTVGETCLHWAVRCANMEIVTQMVQRGFDVNAREFSRGRTPLFMAATRAIAKKLIELGADQNAVDAAGTRIIDVIDPTCMTKMPTKSIQLTVVTIAISGTDRIRDLGNRTIAEAIILASTLGRGTPLPERGIYGKDRLRPGRFAWSQKQLSIEEGWPRDFGELPIAWIVSEQDSSHQICIRLCDVEWLKAKKEKIDVVVFAHSVEDPTGISRLTQKAIPEAKASELLRGATMVMLGVGSEARSDMRRIDELARKHSHMASVDRCRSVARHSRLSGFLECTADPATFRGVLVQIAGIHITAASLSKGGSVAAGLSHFALPQTDNRLLPPALADDEELRETKVLILGHQAGGKTTFLRRLEEEDSRKQTLLKRVAHQLAELPQPKSTAGIKFKEFHNVAKPVMLRVLDFAGQTEYSTIHEHFLSPFNSLYVIVVNMSGEDYRSQVRYWMQSLQTHARGPRAGSCLLVVGTMSDLVVGGTEAIRARERAMKEEATSWGIASQMVMFRVVSVSNRSGDGLKDAWKAVKTMSQAIGSIKVPRSFKRAEADIVKKVADSHQAFVRLASLHTLVKDGSVRAEITAHEAWSDFMIHLHDIGVAVFEPASTVACLNVDVLARMTSVFVAPDHHIGRLLENPEERQLRTDIVSKKEAVERMMGVKGLATILGSNKQSWADQCEMAIQMLKDCKICFELTREEEETNDGQQGLMFPSLRVSCDIISVPFHQLAQAEPKRSLVSLCSPMWLCLVCNKPREGTSPGSCPDCQMDYVEQRCTLFARSGIPHEPFPRDPIEVVASEEGYFVCVANGGSPVKVDQRLAGQGCVRINESTSGRGQRILGARLRSTRRDLGITSFSKAIVGLRPFLDPRFRVFSNSAVLRGEAGTHVLIAIRSSSQGISGSASQQQQQQQQQKKKIGDQPAPPATQPKGDDENEIIIVAHGQSPGNWKKSIGAELFELCDLNEPLCPVCAQGDSFVPLEATSSGRLRCSTGHDVTREEAEAGVAMLQTHRHHRLWAPLHGDAFLKCAPEMWHAEGPARITELTDQEEQPARKAEYLRARKAFYEFVGADREKTLVLKKVEFIENDVLEARFLAFFDRLVQRTMSRRESRCDPAARADSKEVAEWREWVLRQLAKSVMRVSGNESINLMLGWHGSSEESIKKIAQTGFLEPDELEAAGIKVTDPGWYAPGLYFTSFPSYGAKYAAIKKSNCLLVSWVLLGRPFPVVEAAGVLKKRVDPYDSHFVVVDSKYGAPCKPKDPPGKDEIIVFSKSQVLPRFIFHFYETKQESQSVESIPVLPQEIREARPLVIWIDQNIGTIDLSTGALKTFAPKMTVLKCGSSNEAGIWLKKYGKIVANRLCVVTNRFRELDGGEEAWVRAIEVVRGASLPRVHIVVFCQEPKKCVGKWQRVTVTNEPVVLGKLLQKIARLSFIP